MPMTEDTKRKMAEGRERKKRDAAKRAESGAAALAIKCSAHASMCSNLAKDGTPSMRAAALKDAGALLASAAKALGK